MFKNNLDKIIDSFQKKGLVVVALRSGRDIDINEIIASINEDEWLKIIAAGGDGTINVVVNAMIKNDCHLPLAIFPAGTANDFAHYFSIPKDLDGMLSIALEENYMTADVGKCNDKYFVNVAAIGSVIDVSQKTDTNMKNALGIVAYYLKGLTELHALKPVEVTVEAPDRSLTEKIFFMVVLNGSSAGGFRKLGIQSLIDDGLLDVIMFKDMKITDMPIVGIQVLQGKHDENDNVIYFQTPKLRITSSQPISTDVDGESGEPLPLDIELLPNRIMINTRKADDNKDKLADFQVDKDDKSENSSPQRDSEISENSSPQRDSEISENSSPQRDSEISENSSLRQDSEISENSSLRQDSEISEKVDV